MLRSVEEMYGYRVQASDSEVGHVDDFYFDDAHWIVRYLVVETGNWLTQRHVVVPPQALQEPSWVAGILPVKLTADQIRESPEADLQEQISRQYEETLHAHYGWDYYWLAMQTPDDAAESQVDRPATAEDRGETQLRRTRQLSGFQVRAQGEDVGRVSDFLVDDEKWILHYLVVETGGWLPDKKVLLASSWVEQLSVASGRLSVNVAPELIEGSPTYDPTAPVSRDEEETLYDYYERPKYWL